MPPKNGDALPTFGITFYATNTRRGAHKLRHLSNQDLSDTVPTLKKPIEPDFSDHDEDKM